MGEGMGFRAAAPCLGTLTITPFLLLESVDALGQARLQKDPWVSSQRAEKVGHGTPPPPPWVRCFC